MKGWTKAVGDITLLTQFGFSFITPLLLCLGLCGWLSSKGVGAWVFIPGFILGFGGSAMVAYKFYLQIMSRLKKEYQEENNKDSHSNKEAARKTIKKKRTSFNRHE